MSDLIPILNKYFKKILGIPREKSRAVSEFFLITQELYDEIKDHKELADFIKELPDGMETFLDDYTRFVSWNPVENKLLIRKSNEKLVRNAIVARMYALIGKYMMEYAPDKAEIFSEVYKTLVEGADVTSESKEVERKMSYATMNLKHVEQISEHEIYDKNTRKKLKDWTAFLSDFGRMDYKLIGRSDAICVLLTKMEKYSEMYGKLKKMGKNASDLLSEIKECRNLVYLLVKSTIKHIRRQAEKFKRIVKEKIEEVPVSAMPKLHENKKHVRIEKHSLYKLVLETIEKGPASFQEIEDEALRRGIDVPTEEIAKVITRLKAEKKIKLGKDFKWELA